MLSVKQLRAYLREGRNDLAPAHKRMKRWREFYCNKSWDSDDKAKVEGRGQKAVEVNIVAPASDLLVGLMSGVQMDYDAKPMTSMGRQVGRDATWALKHVNTINDLDMLRRLVTEDSVIEGVGVMLSGPYVRDEDPSREIVQYTRIPAQWYWYDIDAIDPVLRDARYQGFSRWIPFGMLAAAYPGKASQIENLKGDPDLVQGQVERYWAPLQTATTLAIPPLDRWSTSDWNLADRHQEVDRHKNQIMVHEIYYRDYEKAFFFVSTDGQAKQFDPVKEFDLLLRPEVKAFFSAKAPVIRRARLVGPIRLDDIALPVNDYPTVPYFWKRDEMGLPFSFVQQIEHQQQELNARRARALWQSNSNQSQLDDAYWEDHTEEDFEELREELGKPNGILKASPLHLTPWSSQNSHDQMPWIARADAEVQMAAGITSQLAGQDAGMSPRSAEANRQQTMQGGMTFEARRANFNFAFKQFGKVALQWIVKLHPSPFPVMVSDNPGDPDVLHQVRVEDVDHLIGLDIGPFTPTMLEKQVETLRLLLPMLPPDPRLQAEGTIFLLSSMNLPGIGRLQQSMLDFLARIESGAQEPLAMQQPAYRPRQKRRTTPSPVTAAVG